MLYILKVFPITNTTFDVTHVEPGRLCNVKKAPFKEEMNIQRGCDCASGHTALGGVAGIQT